MRRRGPRIWRITCLLILGAGGVVRAEETPAGLPRYGLQVTLDTTQALVKVRQTVTWTNRTESPTKELVFNAHSHYSIPDKDIGFLAKTTEYLRMAPREAMSFDGPPLRVEQVFYRPPPRTPTINLEPSQSVQTGPSDNNGMPTPKPQPPTGVKSQADLAVPFHFPDNNPTALIVPLPTEVKPGDAVTLVLTYELKLPQRKGRWGQWEGITTLAQWIPVLAIFDGHKGWQPTPFIPWHQPFYNEAGHYAVTVRLPSDQKLAASAPARSEEDLHDGWKEIVFDEVCMRDFALIASARFQEWTGEADGVKIRCLALPEHEFYAQTFIDTVRTALPVYNRWFGKYAYSQFTIVESCFGWNGNECGGLVMIDDRMFNMPHIAKNYPIYLLQHELCHQWWYNVVGTDGYRETWMDEGPATYFSHRLADRTLGRNNKIIELPKGFDWVTNIHREDLRNYSMVGTWARGDARATVPENGMPDFGHLVNLTSATYDRGSKVIGMIEERMGEENFLDCMRLIYRKYRLRILLVADFQRELELFTGRSWDDFFRHWVRGTGQCDWSVEGVEIDGRQTPLVRIPRLSRNNQPVRVVVNLRQQGDFNEPTTLGFRLQDGNEYQVRVPIHPDVPFLRLDPLHAQVESTTDTKDKKQQAMVRVEVELPSEPLQISVDPDRILLDDHPTNNHWKQEIRWHLTPLYSQLDEIDVSNAYDKWNVNIGPWIYLSTYTDPWYAKSNMIGFRAGVYRTQELDAGAYIAYRQTDRNIVAGADAFWDHVLLPNVQVGINAERAIGALSSDGIFDSRAVIFSRYILMYGSSLYQPPFEYVQTFAMIQDRALPTLREHMRDTNPYDQRHSVGINYHKNLMTPYWDAEGGYSLDVTYQYGVPIFRNDRSFHELYGQIAYLQRMPRLLEGIYDGPLLRWLYDTRFAYRIGGAAGLPGGGLLFPLGGADKFRGFDVSERQGNMIWVGSVEWRVPLATNLHWDFFDHIAGVRNLFLVPFFDAGNSYVHGREVGHTAQAPGVGFAADVTWLGLIERTMLRVDVAKPINSHAPAQFWLLLSHPF